MGDGSDWIIRGLWLGSMYDADKARAEHVLCVMWENEPGVSGKAHCIQTTRPSGYGVVTDSAKMDEAADWIEERLSKGSDVLVHCAYGMERAPLTVVWFLMRHRGMNLSQAYELVKLRRKEVLDRKSWLPERVKADWTLPPRVQQLA